MELRVYVEKDYLCFYKNSTNLLEAPHISSIPPWYPIHANKTSLSQTRVVETSFN